MTREYGISHKCPNHTEFLQCKICIMDHLDTQKFMYRVKDVYLTIFLMVL